MLVIAPGADVDMADNYKLKLARLWQSGALRPVHGAVGVLEVRHDDSCAFWRGGRCGCDPDLEVRWTPREGSG